MDKQHIASEHFEMPVRLPHTLSTRRQNSATAYTHTACQTEDHPYQPDGIQEVTNFQSHPGSEADLFFNNYGDATEHLCESNSKDRIDVGVQKHDFEPQQIIIEADSPHKGVFLPSAYEVIYVKEALDNINTALEQLAQTIDRIENVQTSILKRARRRRRYSQFLID